MPRKRILVLGASGYVGTRLIPRLLEDGYLIRAAARSPDRLARHYWASHPDVECVPVDMQDPGGLKKALKDCDSAYYLVHSMLSSKKRFVEADRKAAENMIWASENTDLERIIYLGGLGDEKDDLGEHLRSRLEVANILRSGKVPATVLRAAMILGSGSASFESLRYLVERLPVMTTPRWVHTRSQPIAITNVIEYLAGCLKHQETAGETYDIGGPDIFSYRELFDLYAKEAKLKPRWIIRVPAITPKLSSYWVALVTPIPLNLIYPLIDGLRIKAVCRENRIRDIIPQTLFTCRLAIKRALDPRQYFSRMEYTGNPEDFIPYEWSLPTDAAYSGGQVFSESLRIETKMGPDKLWEPLEQISCELSCCYNDFLWKQWRRFDNFAGRVGAGMGMPGTTGKASTGVFWKVVDKIEGKRLVIAAEVELFGWMLKEFQIKSAANGHSTLSFNVRFHPRGLGGIAYWYATLPLHKIVFYSIINWIAESTGKINECSIS